eukprot:COSAG01_NODE_6287_length_3752_cov_23.350123_1_plen_359_part_00
MARLYAGPALDLSAKPQGPRPPDAPATGPARILHTDRMAGVLVAQSGDTLHALPLPQPPPCDAAAAAAAPPPSTALAPPVSTGGGEVIALQFSPDLMALALQRTPTELELRALGSASGGAPTTSFSTISCAGGRGQPRTILGWWWVSSTTLLLVTSATLETYTLRPVDLEAAAAAGGGGSPHRPTAVEKLEGAWALYEPLAQVRPGFPAPCAGGHAPGYRSDLARSQLPHFLFPHVLRACVWRRQVVAVATGKACTSMRLFKVNSRPPQGPSSSYSSPMRGGGGVKDLQKLPNIEVMMGGACSLPQSVGAGLGRPCAMSVPCRATAEEGVTGLLRQARRAPGGAGAAGSGRRCGVRTC